MSAIRVIDWSPRRSGALRGFATIETPSGLVFHETGVFEQGGRWWAAPASKPMVGRDGTVLKDERGKVRYAPVVTFTEKGRRDLWSASVVEALHGAYPELRG